MKLTKRSLVVLGQIITKNPPDGYDCWTPEALNDELPFKKRQITYELRKLRDGGYIKDSNVADRLEVFDFVKDAKDDNGRISRPAEQIYEYMVENDEVPSAMLPDIIDSFDSGANHAIKKLMGGMTQ